MIRSENRHYSYAKRLAARQKNATMKSRYQIILILSFLLINFCGFSQEAHSHLGLTLDLGGNSGGYSVNGEYEILNHDKFKANARLGFGYLPIKNTSFLDIPFGINFLTGNQKHHLELGIGSSYISGLKFTNIQIGSNDKSYADKAIYLVPSIGYRFDKLSGGLILKIYYSPLILIHDFLNEDKFKNEAIPDGIVFGNTTKKDYFDYFFGDSFLPKAKSNYGYFGISIGFRIKK